MNLKVRIESAVDDIISILEKHEKGAILRNFYSFKKMYNDLASFSIYSVSLGGDVSHCCKATTIVGALGSQCTALELSEARPLP